MKGLMTTLDFFKTVSCGKNPSLGLWTGGQIDGYFCFDDVRYEIVEGKKQGNALGVHPIRVESSLLFQIFKIVSLCTVILPLIFGVAKCIFRSIYQFYIIEENKISKHAPVNEKFSEKPEQNPPKKCCCKKNGKESETLPINNCPT